ncbi:MAG: hypothetical protein SGPRY_004762 [Prymnesium sp.]
MAHCEVERVLATKPEKFVRAFHLSNPEARFATCGARLLQFEVLGVSIDAGASGFKRSYYKLSRLVHPDKCDHPRSTEAFQRIHAAWVTLSDPTKLAAYMATQRAPPQPKQNPAPAGPPSEVVQQLRKQLVCCSMAELKVLCLKLGVAGYGRKDQMAERIADRISAYGDAQACMAKLQLMLTGARVARMVQDLPSVQHSKLWNSGPDLRKILDQAAQCGLNVTNLPVRQHTNPLTSNGMTSCHCTQALGKVLARVEALEAAVSSQGAKNAPPPPPSSAETEAQKSMMREEAARKRVQAEQMMREEAARRRVQAEQEQVEAIRRAHEEELRQQAVERSRREAEEERARRKREADLKRDTEAAAASRARAAQEGKENASSPGARGTKRADAVCHIYIHGLEHMH